MPADRRWNLNSRTAAVGVCPASDGGFRSGPVEGFLRNSASQIPEVRRPPHAGHLRRRPRPTQFAADAVMIKTLAQSALLVPLLLGTALAQEPGRLPPTKPASILSRLLGRPKPPPLSPRNLAPAARRPVEIVPNESSGVVRASWEEPAPTRAAPPKRSRGLPWPSSWFHLKRRPSRTVSEFMAEERP